MTADRLREAAKVLRAYVDKLTTDTERWDGAFPSGRGLYADTSSYERLIVHPRVGLALAEWLDATASTAAHLEDDLAAVAGRPDITQLVGYDFAEAIALADAVLGGAA